MLHFQSISTKLDVGKTGPLTERIDQNRCSEMAAKMRGAEKEKGLPRISLLFRLPVHAEYGTEIKVLDWSQICRHGGLPH